MIPTFRCFCVRLVCSTFPRQWWIPFFQMSPCWFHISIIHFLSPYLTLPYLFVIFHFLFVFGLFCHAFLGENSSENCHLEYLQRARPDFHGAQFHSQPGVTAATYADSAGHYGQTSRKNPGIYPRKRHCGRLWRCEFVSSVVVGGGSSSRQTATPFGMGWAKEAVRIVH